MLLFERKQCHRLTENIPPSHEVMLPFMYELQVSGPYLRAVTMPNIAAHCNEGDRSTTESDEQITVESPTRAGARHSLYNPSLHP